MVAQTRSAGELQRNAAIGLGAVATGAAGAALWFWLTGEDPGQYEPGP